MDQDDDDIFKRKVYKWFISLLQILLDVYYKDFNNIIENIFQNKRIIDAYHSHNAKYMTYRFFVSSKTRSLFIKTSSRLMILERLCIKITVIFLSSQSFT